MSDHLQNIEVAPDWLRDECLAFLKRFGFDSWRVKVFVCDTPEANGRKMMGEALPDSTYLQGHIHFDRSITPEDKNDIYHECLHLVFSELEHSIDHHIIGAMAGEYASHYMSIYMWHFERLIERTARAFAEDSQTQ